MASYIQTSLNSIHFLQNCFVFMAESPHLPSSPKHSSSPNEERNDRVLWQCFRLGDRLAFERLLKIHYTGLLNYGLRISGDREFVKDCLHDLFVDLWNRKEQLQEVHALKPYLLVAFRRRLIKESKRNQWFRKADEVEEDYNFDVQFNIESYLINNEVRHESLVRLQSNLDKLTKRQREVIYLRFYQEMEYEEIAQSLKINYHSVVNLMYEGMKLLRKNWFLILVATSPILS